MWYLRFCLTLSVNIWHLFYPTIDTPRRIPRTSDQMHPSFTSGIGNVKKSPHMLNNLKHTNKTCTLIMILMKNISLWNLSLAKMISQRHFGLTWSVIFISYRFSKLLNLLTQSHIVQKYTFLFEPNIFNILFYSHPGSQ